MSKSKKRKSMRNGYVTVYCPDHPKASKDGYVYEHVYIMEKLLGRYIKDNEHVHHQDLNNLNNNPENLLCLSHGQHTKLHNFFRKNDLYDVLKATGEEGYQVKECAYCQDYLIANDKFCDNECHDKYRVENKKNRPSKEEIEALLKDYNKVEIGRMYGVHRSTINNWLREYEEAN
ncbi:helix-turn-helix domain-containing protein [Alteribacillus sp. YIM 98480]|uniref:helix-turn-helix domain-containing protein n=1 Tax=Alteribacillus sp. YIM 98480 TaxID=2606599 RepID=UPI00131C981E|nr:helix-turn-helix domain-containing protein [Alteribacillus sp. YIM 98480]